MLTLFPPPLSLSLSKTPEKKPKHKKKREERGVKLYRTMIFFFFFILHGEAIYQSVNISNNLQVPETLSLKILSKQN
jgi:hypothetical protein